MKLPDYEFGFNPGTIALGAAVYFLTPIVAPIAKDAVRAVVKSGMKGGMLLYNNSKHFASGTKNYFQEITDEAKKEASKELKASKK